MNLKSILGSSGSSGVVNSRNSKKSKIKIKKPVLDKYWAITSTSFIILVISAYLNISQNLDLDGLNESIINMKNSIESKENELTKLKKDVMVFNKKIEDTNKKFLEVKDKFGVYKLIIELDKLKKIYPFDYKISEQEKNINQNYKYYELTFMIKYQNSEGFEKTFEKLTNEYYMAFLNGKFDNKIFTLKYNIYAKK